ncbi:COP9 signalosome complex subunit 1-like isoform X2 [Dysidea avara]
MLFIARHCPPLRVEALKLALRELEQTHNTALYSEVKQKIVQCTNNQADGPDTDEAKLFISTTNKKAAIKLERLDTDLKNSKSNSVKESIRRGYDDLGDHFMDCGDLTNALKMYSRARDYCTSAKHIVILCLNIIKVSISLGNWQQVLNYYSKAEANPDSTSEHKSHEQLVVACRLKCAAGLAEMENKRYKNAARYFIMASFDHCSFPDLMSPHDVAVYGGLCALATFDRKDLHDKVLGSSSFKQFLELDPQLRDVITQFYQSKYASCLKTLDGMDTLMLDMYLAHHLQSLCSQIRNRALIQYFKPYVSADLNKMALAFNTSVSNLEDELTQLILDDQISARIDSHAKILYARQIEQRRATFEKSLEIGEAYQLRTKALIVRAAMQHHRISVPPASFNSEQDSNGGAASGR